MPPLRPHWCCSLSLSLLRDTATKHSPLSNDKSKGSEIPEQVLIVVNYGDQEGRHGPMATSKGDRGTNRWFLCCSFSVFVERSHNHNGTKTRQRYPSMWAAQPICRWTPGYSTWPYAAHRAEVPSKFPIPTNLDIATKLRILRLKIFVAVQTFRRRPFVPSHNFCHPGVQPNNSQGHLQSCRFLCQ